MGSSSSSLSAPAKTRSTGRSTRVSHRRTIDPPPPYTDVLPSPGTAESEEDVLESLAKLNMVFIVDDSTSMRGDRWEEAKNALATLAELAGRYSTDGIDVYFLNHEGVGRSINNPDDLRKLFQDVIPKGATPIGNRLEELLTEYLSLIEHHCGEPVELKKIKPVNYLVITDGYPTDDPESVIVQAAKRLDEKYFPTTQVGIQFVQIGNDRTATQYLQQLDDELSNKHKIRDMVDTTPYRGPLDGRSLLKILLGGINRRVDSLGTATLQ